MPQLRVKGRAAVDDVFVLPLLFEPLTNLGAGLRALGDLHPVPAGALGILGGQNLHNIAVFQHMVQRDDAVIHLGADHAVSHGGVDGIGKVNGRGPGGQILHIAVGREHEHLIGKHIHLQGVDKFLGVGALLIFQQAAHPLVFSLRAGALPVLLVLPVGGHAVFGDLVHLPGANLHLKGNTVRPHHSGVEGLVAVGLGSADIIFEAPQNGLIEVMDDAQHIVAVPYGVHHHPECEQIKNLVNGLVLTEHLAVDGVRVLHPSIDNVADVQLLEPLVDLVLRASHEVLILRALGVQLADDLIIADGVEIF